MITKPLADNNRATLLLTSIYLADTLGPSKKSLRLTPEGGDIQGESAMGKDKEEPDFIIQDKRSSHQSEDEIKAGDESHKKEEKKEQAKQAPQGEKGSEQFEINFSTFVLSLTSSAFYYLGDIPDPATGQAQENLPAVKQTIDILIMLKEKTQNNLNVEETKLIEKLIYELQMKYLAKNTK